MIEDTKEALLEGGSQSSNLFAIRGDIDGDTDQDFIEKLQFIGIKIGDEEFLLPISAITDINMLSEITFVPYAPRFVDGVINLRGVILPAINLRKMIGLPKAIPTAATRIIIIRSDDLEVGILVDGLTYVISLMPSEIETHTLASKGRGAELIGSIGKYEEKILGILDLQKIVQVAADGRLAKTDDASPDLAKTV